MSDKKIYVANFWHTRTNYGANLTAYALQTVLVNLGYNVQLVDNPIKVREHINRKFKFSFNFQKKYLNTTRYIDKNADFLNEDCNIFITGSDQVFRPVYTQGKLEQYLLDFVKPNQKKIAFSASFGVDKEQFLKENPSDIVKHMKKSLKSFDFISVREKSGVKISKDIFGIDAEWIIDPVFILEKEKWEGLIDNCHSEANNTKLLADAQNSQLGEESHKYNDKIVAYVLDTNDDYKKAYKYLSDKYNTEVIKTANSNISIENWLASIKNCKLFVTDSFHGMCFALIFNKPFICLANKSRGAARFESICEMLDVEYQCIEDINDVYSKDCVFKVDYERVNQRIEEERQKGLEFLKKALDAPVQITQEKIDARMRYLENQVLELDKRDNLKYQLKKCIWDRWIIIYACYLPRPVKFVISIFWRIIKGVYNACRK